MSGDADFRFVRLKRLPARLRVAHLAALLRWEREKNALSYPSPHERQRVAGRVAVAKRRSGGGANISEKVGLPRLASMDPRPAHRSLPLTMIHPPRKGEGEESARLVKGSPRKGEGSERDPSRRERSSDSDGRAE